MSDHFEHEAAAFIKATNGFVQWHFTLDLADSVNERVFSDQVVNGTVIKHLCGVEVAARNLAESLRIQEHIADARNSMRDSALKLIPYLVRMGNSDLAISVQTIADLAVAGSPNRVREKWPDVLPRLKVFAMQAKLHQDFADQEVITPVAIVDLAKVPDHAPDFSWVRCEHGEFVFSSPRQRQAIGLLWSDWDRDGKGLSQSYLASEVEAGTDRLSNLFKGHRAWNTLIVKVPQTKDMFTLNISKKTRDTQETHF